MKRLHLILILVCLSHPGSAQHAENTRAALLSKELTTTVSGDLEKVKAIFNWITQNISYRTAPLKSGYNFSDNFTFLLSADEIIAETVLETRTAVCDGYARLFRVLCAHAGLRAEVVNGYARTNYGARSFRSNHSWNAVLIKGNWHLLDVTWASGFLSWRGNEFIRNYNGYYFLTPPDQLIKTHYPDDMFWSLLTDIPAMREFRKEPFRQRAFTKYSISKFYPSTGTIKAAVGDTLEFELMLNDPVRDSSIATYSFNDSLIMEQISGTLYLQPIQVVNNIAVYRYIAKPFSSPWLHLLYNGEPVLRYRLELKD